MKHYITLGIGLLLAATAYAQNLNPTVQVTNAYEGKLMEVEKQNIPMAVPDSLLQFDWNFNYSVFDNPYKGAYEFNPYLVEMKPDPVPFDGKNLYVRAGAGYTLHPEVQAVWTPELKGRFKVTVYDDFKGYWGKYSGFNGDLKGLTPDFSGEYFETEILPDSTYVGNEIGNRFGVKAGVVTKPVTLSFDGQFNWLNALWDGRTELNNAFGQSYVLGAKSNFTSAFSFDAALRFDGMSNHPQQFDSNVTDEGYIFDKRLHENDLGADLLLIYNITGPLSFRIKGSYDHTYFRTVEDENEFLIGDWLNISPMCTYEGDRASISAGVKFSDVWKNKDFSDEECYKGKKIYPQLEASYEVIKDALVASAFLTGGQKFNTYASLLEANHFLPINSSLNYFSTLGDASVNTFDAGIAFSGRIKSVFQYKIDGGYARYYNAPMEGLRLDYYTDRPLLRYVMANYDLLYADINGSWRSDRVDASALFRLQKMELTKDSAPALSAPHFVGKADFTYNWNRRIFAGVSAEWSTLRKVRIPYYITDTSNEIPFYFITPGWVDLGVNAEFKMNSKLSFWLKGSNLLGKPVMRNFLIAEKGPYVTVGICLVL